MKKVLISIMLLVSFVIFTGFDQTETNENNKGGSDTFTVTFKIEGNGKITGETVQKVKKGKRTSKVKAIPKNGYVFSGWTGDYTKKRPRLRIKNVQSNMTVIATFTKDGDTGGGTGGLTVCMLAGQSNMVGNLEKDLIQDVMNDINQASGNALETRLVNTLTDWYRNWSNGYAMYGYSKEMVAFEASEIARLKNEGIIEANLTDPYGDVLCSFNDSGVSPLTRNCGNPYGPELMLGHYFGEKAFVPASLIKVAKGGTTLHTDWRSPTMIKNNGGSLGPMYNKLRDRIRTLSSDPQNVHPDCSDGQCKWDAFVWFQGENDCFNNEHANSYKQNLKDFIKDVRSEIGDPNLPVIIVEIGKWAQSLNFGSTVVKAQREFVAEDSNAKIVKTDDLSGFYHYDAASQLIIGARVGKVLETML